MPLELDQPTTDMSQSAEQPIGLQPGEVDREGEMAKQDLTKIASYAEKLDSRLQDSDQLEAWVQKKIAVAAENLASVYHYLAYEMTVNEYAEYLRKNGLLSEGISHPAVRKLMEAKAKIKELKKAQVEKQSDKKVAEGSLRGGERACTECGGSGMVYEEPMPIPDHVKGKVGKYNTMMKATKAAHKRMDANGNGIPDQDEMEEDFDNEKEMKVGDTKNTRTGKLTKTDTGVVHKNTSYHDDGDDIASNAKSGKGVKSHAKSQSASEKKDKAPAQKFSPKSAKTYGMKDGEKFDNRDGAPAKPKKEKEVDETYGRGVYEAKGKCCCEEKGKTKCPVHGKMSESAESNGKKPCPPMSHVKKMCQDGKSVAEICKMHPDCDHTELKQMVADCKDKNDLSKKKDVKETAATAMWKNVKDTAAYMAEKKAIEKKDKPMKGDKMADEGNAVTGGLADKNIPIGSKIPGTDVIKKKQIETESSDFTRMQEQLARLNRSETKTAINENTEVSRLRTLTNLFKG